MAKVLFSALVARMGGKVNGQTMSQWKGINVLKTTGNPRQPRSATQQRIRGIMNDLSGEYYALSSTLKDLWNRYASLLPNPMTGLNAYQYQNANLVRYLGVSKKITNPPPTPSTPESLIGFSAVNTDDTTATIAWTAPSTAGDYVIVDYAFMAGRDDGANPRWSFAGGASASALTVVHTHAFPIGTVLKYRARSMDSYGRLSPNAAVETITVAA